MIPCKVNVLHGVQAAQCEVMALPSTVPGHTSAQDTPQPARHDSDGAVLSGRLRDALRGQIRTLCGGVDQRDATPALGMEATLYPAADSGRDAGNPAVPDATGSPSCIQSL